MQIQQAAAILKISRQWVWELINRGEINTSEIAGRRFVLRDKQFRAIERQRSKKAA